MIFKPLFPLLGTPNPDSVFRKPFYYKRGLIRDTANAVKHKDQQNIKLPLTGVFFDDLELVTVFCPDFVAGNAVLLFLVNDGPALFLRKAVAGFPLHGDVCLTFIIIVHLLTGGHPVKTIDSIFHALFRPFWVIHG